MIEINLTKLERGIRPGKVKVTRGGTTFWREQRVGQKEQDVTIGSILSDIDSGIKKGRGGPATLYVSPEKFMSLCEHRGIDKSDVTEMRKIIDLHATGDDPQKVGDQKLINNLNENTGAGKAFKLLSELETIVANKYLESNDKELEKAKKTYESDLKFYNEIMGDPEDAQIEAQRGLDAAEIRHHENQYIYRKGDTDKDVQSWTVSSGGAWQGKGQESLVPDRKIKINDINKSGYVIIGGFTRKIGQSGEAEILLVKKSEINKEDKKKMAEIADVTTRGMAYASRHLKGAD